MFDWITIASVVSGVISSTTILAALWMRLKHLSDRDEPERMRYEFAALHCSDAYYRGGEKALRAMRETHVDLLRATAPEPRRALIDQSDEPPLPAHSNCRRGTTRRSGPSSPAPRSHRAARHDECGAGGMGLDSTAGYQV
jgi:hypothetical protein